MICPECNGVGSVRKRFLLFFTQRARCPRCLGTGEFPPLAGKVVSRSSYRDDDDNDDDRWTSRRSYGSTGSIVSTETTSSAQDDEPLETGGGASGGAGGGASWDADARDAPVIADPFASEGSSAVDPALADEPIEAADSSSSTSESESSESSSSSSDSGTSY